MKKNNIKSKISYEPEADILTVESSRKPIDYAREIGNMVVHFTKKGEPVLFEILNASHFFMKAENLMEKSGVLKTTLKRQMTLV